MCLHTGSQKGMYRILAVKVRFYFQIEIKNDNKDNDSKKKKEEKSDGPNEPIIIMTIQKSLLLRDDMDSMSLKKTRKKTR